MKKITALIVSIILAVGILAACGGQTPQPGSSSQSSADPVKQYKIGYVTLSLGSDFFQMLADAYKTTFEAAGWEANYTDGQFDPAAQITACENYIAQGVDVLLLWAVAPEAMEGIVAQCKESGIKLIAFVQPTSEYDVCMVADEIALADYTAKLAARWLEEAFPDAPAKSIPTAVVAYTQTDTAKLQTDFFRDIESYSDKIKLETVVEVDTDSIDVGYNTAENLMVTNPDIQLIVSPSNILADGINQYLTSMNSPVTDYSKMGIFCCNGNEAMGEAIRLSKTNEAPLRGMVLTGGIQDTADEMLMYATAVMDGSIQSGSMITAQNVFVYADTVDEYLETGTVKSITQDEFDK